MVKPEELEATQLRYPLSKDHLADAVRFIASGDYVSEGLTVGRDPETQHIHLDIVLRAQLASLGYEDAIALVQNMTLWYA